jgi:hypothetical protein
MAESKPEKPKSGCLSKLSALLLLCIAAGLGFAIFKIVQPQDLSDIGGYGPAAGSANSRDMKVVLKNSIDRGYPVTLTETEINSWLLRVLEAKQTGPLAEKVKFERVWVRLEDGRAEVVMERSILGNPLTISMYLKLEQVESASGVKTQIHLHGGPFHEDFPQPTCGGRFGQLPVPQGFLVMVLPSYRRLAAIFPDEIRLGFEDMARIRIEKDRLVLDPRAPTREEPAIPDTF